MKKNLFLSSLFFCLPLISSAQLSSQWIRATDPWRGSIHSIAAVGTSLFVGTDGGGVFRSTDDGMNWKSLHNGIPNIRVYAFAASDSNIFAGTEKGVFLSIDKGGSWTAVNSGLESQVVFSLAIGRDRSGSKDLFAGTGEGVFLSTDNGQRWTEISVGLTEKFVKTFAFDGTKLFAGTYGGGVFLSTNKGSSWAAVNSGLKEKSIGALFINGSTLFAGTLSGGIFCSTDNGSSWTEANKGLTNHCVWAFATKIGEAGDTNLFAGTPDGVYLSTNNGKSWTEINEGLIDTRVMALAVKDTNLFAGTFKGGVFRSSANNLLPPSVQPAAKYLFHIPAYPGTEEYRSPFNDEGLHMPFATVYKVFKTKNGDSLNCQSVLKFYKDYLEAKGWKEGIDNGSPQEPFLAMAVDLRENLPENVNIFLAGHFYIWVAPKDGMYSILSKQWRTSTPGQKAMNREDRIIGAFRTLSRDLGYEAGSPDYWRSDWEYFYENEYLISWNHVYLYKSPHIVTTVEILTYKDSLVAQQEVERFVRIGREEHWQTITPLSQRAYFVDFKKIVTTGGNKIITSFSNFVILIEASSLSEGKNLKIMLRRFDEIEK